MSYVHQEYPKALYVSADQTGEYRTAGNADEELALRAEGFKPLAEWAAEAAAPEPAAEPADHARKRK